MTKEEIIEKWIVGIPESTETQQKRIDFESDLTKLLDEALKEQREVLQVILDHVDYINGNCGLTEMIGAVLPKEIIDMAKKAIKRGSE